MIARNRRPAHEIGRGQRRRAHVAIRPQRSLFVDLRKVWSYRDLLYFLTWRDVKIRYKQSVVGIGWSILQPLSLMLVFTVFFGRVAHISSNSVPRPLFYFAGLLPWTYFQQAVTSSTNSLVQNAPLVAKVYFPRILLPLSSAVSSLVDLGIALPLVFAMTGLFAVQNIPHATVGIRAAFVPLPILLAAATATSLGIWLSALNARYRDIRYAISFVLQFWLFASPIAYPTTSVPQRWRFLYSFNPLVGAVEGMRWCFTDKGFAVPGLWASIVIVIASLVAGLLYFRRWEGTLADVV